MRRHAVALSLVSALVIAACAEPPATPIPVSGMNGKSLSLAGGGKSYVLLSTGAGLPDGLAESITAAGGVLTSRMDGIGVAVASSDASDFATRAAGIQGIGSVAEDIMLDFYEPNQPVQEVELAGSELEPGPAAHQVGGHETFRLIQWAPDAVSAPAAWAAGYQGAGARVAILDGGIRDNHLDIATNLDASVSTSFVPGQPFNFDQRRNAQGVCNTTDTFWHGTHVAGIVAAPANDIGTVGIAPRATLIGVKVLHCGSGAFSWIINAIYYASTPIAEGGAGADIINMSLGATIQRNGPGVADLLAALGRATTYAYQRGTTVIAAAGNGALDIDHTANIVFVPAMSPHVLTVSATGPLGYAQGATNYDRPASYTNFGQSAIQFAGPGGDSALPGNALCTLPRLPTGTVTTSCWVFDMVMAPCRGSGVSISTYCWASGTSMASPAVAGVAALLIGKNGKMHPSHVEAALRASADDLGKPGNDDFYGRGRVNAARAVQ